MRYDKPVYFQSVSKGPYDASTGDYGEPAVTEVLRRASVTDSSTETMLNLYGGIKQGSLTIRLQRPYTQPFNSIRVENKVYHVDRSRWNRVFVVSEV